jgi:hypothetical protein
VQRIAHSIGSPGLAAGLVTWLVISLRPGRRQVTITERNEQPVTIGRNSRSADYFLLAPGLMQATGERR